MIDRSNLSRIENVLNLDKNQVNLEFINDILRSYRDDDLSILFYTIAEQFKDISSFKQNIFEIVKLLREEKIYDLIILLSKQNYDTCLLEKVLHIEKDEKEIFINLLDSFSDNQFASKGALLNAIDNVTALNKTSTVVIWGSWYGSILIPRLSPKVKKIVSIDLDKMPLQIAKNRLFDNYKNIDYVCDDVFRTHKEVYLDTNLIINTSCEHMPPMKDWKWFGPGAIKEDTFKGTKGEGFGSPKLSSECYFAFQSNNMFGIEGHINCVNSLEEFKDQMPSRAKILYEEEVEDTRGTRYMLVGKFMPL